MAENLHDQIREIKKSLRLSMNGVVSTLQRRQGLDYKINFGVEIPRLKEIAKAHNPSKELASALWQDNIRECKMLAIYLMPQEHHSTIVDEWIKEIRFTEIADHLAMHILCTLPDAAERALQWSKSNERLQAYCGYMTLSHLLRGGTTLSETQEQTLFSNILSIPKEEGSALTAKCASNTLSRYFDNTPGAVKRMRNKATANHATPAWLEALLENYSE